MKYGKELIAELERQIATLEDAKKDRAERIRKGWTDIDDCFVSMECEDRAMTVARKKIELLQNGGLGWFQEYATLDGELVKARRCKTQYGMSWRMEMPSGEVVWTTARTDAGLAKKGIKKVMCLRPAWYEFKTTGSGLWGAYSGTYELIPSDYNYATGEEATEEPIAIAER